MSMSALPATASAAPAKVNAFGRKPSNSQRNDQREQRRHHADGASAADADPVLQGEKGREREHRAGEREVDERDPPARGVGQRDRPAGVERDPTIAAATAP